MPQYVTLSIAAKVDKGPEIKSEVKFEASSYGPVIEETICRNQTEVFEFPVGAASCIDMIVIAADKYSSEKDPCVNHKGQIKLDCSRIKYSLLGEMPKAGEEPTNCAEGNWHTLSRPHVFVNPGICNLCGEGEIKAIAICNELPFEVKIQALAVRKARGNRTDKCKDETCASTASPSAALARR